MLIRKIEINGKECPLGSPLKFEHKYAIRQMLGVLKWEQFIQEKEMQLEIKNDKKTTYLTLKLENDMMFIEG